MELTLANHSSYPRIGDSAEHQLLRRTIGQRDKGEATDADVRGAEDRMTEYALRDQVEAGLDVVTDGLIRWYDPISHLAGKIGGVKINGLLRFFDTNCYFRQPVVNAKLERAKPLVVEEFQFARSKSVRPVKPVLTGAVTLARHSIEENGRGGGLQARVEGFTAVLEEEVAALAAAGATLIQVDEPALLKHPEDFSLVERSAARLAARKGAARLALAFYFGDPAPLYEKLQKLSADALALDFTYSASLADAIAAGSAKTLSVGLVDGRNTRLEEAGVAARQLEKIARGVKSASAMLTPSCGLEYLPRDRALAKLKHLAVIKQAFLGSAA